MLLCRVYTRVGILVYHLVLVSSACAHSTLLPAAPLQALRTADFRKVADIWATMQQRLIRPDMETLKAFLK